MKLSTLYTAVPAYLEFAWLAAPNASQDALTSNALNTLKITNEIVDTDGNGSIASNQITLKAGTYYLEASVPIYNGATEGCVIGLYWADVTSTPNYIRSSTSWLSGQRGEAQLSTQFVVASDNTKFELIAAPNNHDTAYVSTRYSRSYVGEKDFTLSTPTLQRTTIKLWKLK